MDDPPIGVGVDPSRSCDHDAPDHGTVYKVLETGSTQITVPGMSMAISSSFILRVLGSVLLQSIFMREILPGVVLNQTSPEELVRRYP